MNKISIIVITLNEVHSIADVLNEIPSSVADEVLVVDGYSTDGTVELVKKMGYPVIFQEGVGYGAAFSTGVKYSRGDVLVLMDSDGSHNPKDIPLLLEKISTGYDVALGSRYLIGSRSYDDTLIRYIGNKLFTFLTNRIHRMNISDSLYMFVAAKRKVFDSIELKSKDFGYCVEFPIKAYKAGFKFAEVPSSERKRIAGKSRVNAFWDGLKILKVILKS